MRNAGFLLAFTISLLPLTGGANNPPDGKTPPSPTRALSATPLLVDKVEGLGLFLEEQHETRILLAGWARQKGLSVVDVERTQQIFARASAGEHVETGAKCGRPLPTIEIAERWHKELGAEGRLQAGVSCKKSKCTLAVQVVDALDFDGNYLAEYAAPFAPKLPWRTALPRALAALVRLTANDDGGG